MRDARELYISVRKGLENFSAHITHATVTYKRKSSGADASSKDLNSDNGTDFDSTEIATEENDFINTVGSSIDNFVKVMI